MANTDTKHYLHLTSNVYRYLKESKTSTILLSNIFRFTPAFTTKNDLSRFHGYDERISLKNYVQVVEFYYRLIRNSDTKLHTEAGEEEGSGSGDEIYYNGEEEEYELLPDSE